MPGSGTADTHLPHPGAPRNRIPDTSLNVNYNVTPAVVRASNPSVALTQASITVPLLVPGTKYLERWNQIDLRLAKKFTIARVKMQGQFDMFNILNASSILSSIEAYGSSLDRPATILQGRLFAVGLQANF